MRQLLERVQAWRTTSIGVTGTAVALYLFNTLGCRWPESHEWVAVILPAVLGILSRDGKRVSK